MTRDHNSTTPPARAHQQRDYRARREQYVTDLEERIRRTEEENNQLRGQLAATQAGQNPPPPFDARTAHASSELMQSLSVASASLARYHQLAFSEHRNPPGSRQLPPEQSHSSPSHLSSEAANTSRSASFPSSAPSLHPTSNATTSRGYNPAQGTRAQQPINGHSGNSSTRDVTKDDSKSSTAAHNASTTR